MNREEIQEPVSRHLWEQFKKRFKSDTTEASYWSDILEFCRQTGKPFVRTDREDVRRYYEYTTKRVKEGRLSPITRTKKFRELHSFASFLMEQGVYMPGSEYDYFYPYLKNMKKESRLADHVPVRDMDALLGAACGDRMAYTILTLLYRAGLTSTEIISLRGEADFLEYGEGACVTLSGREEPCYIPEDAWEILRDYMAWRERFPTLFYNRSGRPLNTMYISRMMKKYCAAAGIPDYSAQDVRNSCAFNLFAYGADDVQAAEQMGRTVRQIQRYRGALYRKELREHAADLVKIRIEKP
ncbi:MAG TPA: tyrosine-type recombinase/integrase [Candidatus Mediterraneibacter merdipullorum]|nr:tyrosine-type recombinase/integrase [Candidatus Mediterraneibacter merdipullorum]